MSTKNAVVEIVRVKPELQVPTFAAAKKAALSVLKKEEEFGKGVQLTDAEEDLLRKAVEIQQQSAQVMVSYFELCEFVRQLKSPPKVVRALLFSAGWNKVRVSELMKVSMSSDAIFREYAEKAIGFRVALERARLEDKFLESAPAVPEKWRPVLHEVVEDLLRDNRKATLEIDGVRVVLIRSKPKQVQMNLEPEKAAPVSSKPKKKGKK